MFALLQRPTTPLTVFNVGKDFDADLVFAEYDDAVVTTFSSPEELRRSHITGAEYRELYTLGTGKEAPKKFKSKQEAANRVWPFMEKLAEDLDVWESIRQVPAEKVTKKVTHRRSQGINIEPQENLVAMKLHSKQWYLADQLEAGSTMARILQQWTNGTPWTESSIKSAMYWDLSKVKGYGIKTEFLNGQEFWEGNEFEAGNELNYYRPGHPDDGCEDEYVPDDNYNPNDKMAFYTLLFPEGVRREILLKEKKEV
tara:strand:- start:340 stop:1104 length:765 start_codon:yes stop_codon:yes gene_type:complete